MVPIYRKLTALLTVAFLTFTFALGGTALAIISLDGNVGANPATTPLFSFDGTMNAGQAASIVANINAGAVLDRNAEFRLFSDTGAATTDVGRLSRLTWRMTDISGDRVTFWAAGAYRNLGFHTNANANSQVYSSSNLRSTMVADFGQLTTSWASATVNSNIPTLAVLTDNANSNDRIWLPRTADVQNGGAWGLNDMTRSFVTNGFSNNSWLRTATRNGVTQVNQTEWRAIIGTQTRGISWGYYSCYGWCPWPALTTYTNPRALGTWTNNHTWVLANHAIGRVFGTWNNDDGYGNVTQESREVVIRHETRTVTAVAHVAGTAAAVTNAGAMRIGVADNPVNVAMSVRPAIHVSLAQLQAAAEGAGNGGGPVTPEETIDITAAFSGLAAPTARVNIQGGALQTAPQTVEDVPAGRGTWLEFSVTDSSQMIDALTINGRAVDITPYFRQSAEMRTAMVTHFGAIYMDATRRSVQIEVWNIRGDLTIVANVAEWEPLPPVFQLGAGLAELISLSHQESLTQGDFRAPQAANFASFNSALFNAENALFYLEKLTPFEVMIYANDLRMALALRA